MYQCQGMTVQSINDIVTEYCSRYQGNSTPVNCISETDLKALCLNEQREKRGCQHKEEDITEQLSAGFGNWCVSEVYNIKSFRGPLLLIFYKLVMRVTVFLVFLSQCLNEELLWGGRGTLNSSTISQLPF